MDIMPKFVENLNFLISEKDLTNKQLAKDLGINEPTLSRYRKGINMPSLTNLLKLANYFNCSVAYLIGVEEAYLSANFKLNPPIPLRMAELPSILGVSAYKLCRDVGISESSYYEWKNGSSEPNIYSIIKIADYYGHSIDFILGRES